MSVDIREAAVMESLAENRVVQQYYADHPEDVSETVTLDKILNYAKNEYEENPDDPNKEHFGAQMEILEDYFKPESGRNPEEYAIHDYKRTWSSTKGTEDPEWETNMLITTPDNGVYVAYRGTDEGEGYDNAEMIYQESTLQQREALEYFESLVENEKHSDLFINGNVNLVGHSKGGNKAMYVTMKSRYADYIDNCISIDGPGYSPEAIASFKMEPDYDVRRSKITQIAGQYDFVHAIGEPVVDEVYYYKTEPTGNVNSLHWNEYLFQKDKDGRFSSELNVRVDKPHALVEYEKEFFEEFCKLSPEQRKESARFLMPLLWEKDSPNGNNVDANVLVFIASFCNDPVQAIKLISAALMAANPSEETLEAIGKALAILGGSILSSPALLWSISTLLLGAGIVSKIYSAFSKDQAKKQKEMIEEMSAREAQEHPEFWIDPYILAQGSCLDSHDGVAAYGRIGTQIDAVQSRLRVHANRSIPESSILTHGRGESFDPAEIARLQAMQKKIENKKKEIRQMQQNILEGVEQLEQIKQTLNAMVSYMSNTGTSFMNVEKYITDEVQAWSGTAMSKK